MSDRWVLSRAGILNVYQYGDEILHFGGGRLLLRGVNGSGKSSAMNMLLPFLLEADTRRIDASGVQQGVLRSWMLSGRDEPQPIGYLWLEVRRGDDCLVFGCGIRASRSTDNVTTWWFITDKRPGIDVNLLDGRTPRSLDSLREALGPESSVFTRDQRVAYRAELRSHLFGGAEIAQHVRLLHVLRNPTVGDRIDTDLPNYLNEALPQLSEQAIDDAAQPLEDLEEHRDNVARLTATDTALHALGSMYGAYARTELGLASDSALAAVDRVAQLGRDHRRKKQGAEAAVVALEQARAAVSLLIADAQRLRGEIAALKDQPLYQEGRALEDLRHHVRTLDEAVGSAATRLERVRARQTAEHDHWQQASDDVRADRDLVINKLGHLTAALDTHAVDATVPDLPAVDLDRDGVTGPEVDPNGAVAESAGPDEAVAREDRGVRGKTDGDAVGSDRPPPFAEQIGRQLGGVRTAIRVRREEVHEVQQSIIDVEAAAAAVVQHGSAAERARVEHDDAMADLAEKRGASHSALADLQTALGVWRADVASFAADVIGAASPPPDVTDVVDLRGERIEVRAALAAWSNGLARNLDREVANGEAEVAAASKVVAEASTELDVLLDRSEPDPPLLPWQVRSESLTLAELIDFADTVGNQERLGIEAAMEASGLLGATVRHGGLVLETGELIVADGQPVADPLSERLVATLPASGDAGVSQDQVEAILASISTDPNSDASTAIGSDGQFRIGMLQGRHERDRVELIGATARRESLERLRADARSALADAEAECVTLQTTLDEWRGKQATAVSFADRLPGVSEVDRAIAQEDGAADLVDRRAVALDQVESERRAAETARDHADDALRRKAATLRLPRVAAELREVDYSLTDAQHQLTDIDHAVRSLDRSRSAWSSARIRFAAIERELTDAHRESDAAVAERDPLAARLATLEDGMGAAFQELLDALELSEEELGRTEGELPTAQDQANQMAEQKATAEARADAARDLLDATEAESIGHLDRLRAVLDVPGLTLAAWAADVERSGADNVVEAEAFTLPAPPTVERTSDGVATLARWIAEQRPADPDLTATASAMDTDSDGDGDLDLEDVPHRDWAPSGPDSARGVSADSVRMSLRQRRNSLGAGWDAEDRQPDQSLPMGIEVNGPEGRFSLAEAARVVRRRLDQQRNLLDAKQTQALRNLLQGLIAKEVAAKLHAARELIGLMNARLKAVHTTHGIGVSLDWRRRDDLDEELGGMIDLLAKPPDLRTEDEDRQLVVDISRRIDDGRDLDPEAPYRDLIASVLDYRTWHELRIMLHRPNQNPQRLGRRTGLSEGEKKIVTYLPLFAAAAASCDAIGELEPAAPRFVLLDDAFAKVSADNHEKLFGLLVEMDLDFIATSERLWGTHASIPELAITEVVRDAKAGVILLEHSTWNGSVLVAGTGQDAAAHD